MKRKRHTPEQIVRKLREADRLKAEGQTLAGVCQRLEVSEQTYHRWRNEYGGSGVKEVRRLRDLEKENARLKKAVADLTLDQQILKEMIDDLGKG